MFTKCEHRITWLASRPIAEGDPGELTFHPPVKYEIFVIYFQTSSTRSPNFLPRIPSLGTSRSNTLQLVMPFDIPKLRLSNETTSSGPNATCSSRCEWRARESTALLDQGAVNTARNLRWSRQEDRGGFVLFPCSQAVREPSLATESLYQSEQPFKLRSDITDLPPYRTPTSPRQTVGPHVPPAVTSLVLALSSPRVIDVLRDRFLVHFAPSRPMQRFTLVSPPNGLGVLLPLNDRRLSFMAERLFHDTLAVNNEGHLAGPVTCNSEGFRDRFTCDGVGPRVLRCERKVNSGRNF